MSAAKQVNRPTDPKFKEQDVNNKLQLYGIYSAFAKGKVPSNKQIDIALNSFLQHKWLTSPNEKLSPEGKHLIQDVREVVEQAKLLLLSKNEGNLLQEFIWETQRISGADAALPGAPVDKSTAQQHGNEAAEGLRQLGQLILSNGQFRKLLNDAAILVRSMAGDAASKAATKVNPTEDQLSQIDHPAEDNTWHENPDLSKEALKNRANQYKPFSKKDVQQAAEQGNAQATGSTDPQDTARIAEQNRQQGQSATAGVDTVGGIDQTAHTLNQKLDENVPEQKSKAKEYNARTRGYLKNQMPKERREQTIWRLKKMLVEIQGHPEYQRAIETLLRLAEEYTGHTRTLATQSTGTVKDIYARSKPALTPFKTLLERFANGTSSQDFFDSVDEIYKAADNDQELKQWFRDVNTFIRRSLREQGFIIRDDSNQQYENLYDRGQYLLRNKYRSHSNRLLDEIKFFGLQFDEDKQNRAFGQAVQKLFLDLGNDETGKSVFKPHLLKDVTEIIIPQFLESLHYIPIPRLEYSDPQFDVIIENLIVESDNLAPNVLEIENENHFKWGRKAGNKSTNKNKVAVAVAGIQMDLRDVSFYLNRKQGFPSIKDKGLADIFLGGEGFSFKLKLETQEQREGVHHFFKVSDVKVQVKNFDIKLKKSNHKLLFALGKPILKRAIRPALQKVLEAAIKEQSKRLDGFLWEVYQEVQRAKREAKDNPDPENVKNIYQQYYSAFQSRLTQAKQKKEKAEEKLENKKFNAAMTQHDSIFKDIELPSGISTKATEYKDLAAKGDRWESPVFSIGSAKESASIPSAPKVTRKTHRVTPLPSNNQTLDQVQGGGVGYATQQSIGQQPISSYGQQTGSAATHPAFATGTGPVGQNGATGLQGNGIGNNGIYNDGYNGPTNTGAKFGQQVDRAFDPTQVP